MHKIASFDVFDTCLIRTRPFPSDVFYEIAIELQQSAHSYFGRNFAEDFRAARSTAETVALKNLKTGEEVTLETIWRQLALTTGLPNWRDGMLAELRSEERCIRANARMILAVNAERTRGSRIAFLSDMYLPSEFILDRLRHHGFFQDGDVLMVSSSVGLTKRSGNLFRHLAEKEGVAFKEIHHTGDNLHSDVAVPARLGMAVRHCRDAHLEAPELAIVNSAYEDTSFASRMAGAMRSFRLASQGTEAENGLRDFAASFLAPVLTTFASWVLGQATRDGVRRLYFLSRDCYLLRQVAMRLAAGSGIECRYLKVSRQALFLPSATAVSEAGMPWMKRWFETPTLDRLVAKLGLDEPEAPELTSRIYASIGGKDTLTHDADWAAFWRVIGQEPTHSKIQARIDKRRVDAVGYFESQGMLDGTPWAIVDLGWWLTCQTALNEILGIASPDKGVRGYYLGLQSGRLTATDAGTATPLFYAAPLDRPAGVAQPHIFPRATLLEHLFGIAPHGTVRYYQPSPNGVASAVCAEVKVEVESLSSEMEGLLAEFVSQHWEPGLPPPASAVARGVIDRLIGTCLSHPKRQWCEALMPIDVSADQNNIGSVPLASPMTWGRVISNRMSGSVGARYRFNGPVHWPEADECITRGALQTALKAVHLLRLTKKTLVASTR